MDREGSGEQAHRSPRAGPLPRVVHLTKDFPDPINPSKTQAIRRLVDATADHFDHVVFSLNRRDPAKGDWRGWTGRDLEIDEQPFPHGIAAIYRAPPKSLFHISVLDRMGEWLAARIARLPGPPPALIVGHKLTIEGVAARRAAQLLDVPYALSIQGNTDERIMRVRPDLGRLYRQVLREAKAVFPFSPWVVDMLDRRLGLAPASPILLPCMTQLDTPLAPVPGGDGLVTAFHLRNWRTKNFDRVVAAQRLRASRGATTGLAVIGGGDDEASARCRRIGSDVPGLALEGPLTPSELPARLNRAVAFVMPSRHETFGMAFIEALFAGLPIIYPAGRAIDGFFDDAGFAIRVDPGSTSAIADAMDLAVAREAELKAELAAWQVSDRARRFTRTAIGQDFVRGLDQAIRSAR